MEKEYQIEDFSPFAEITDKVWHSFNIIRSSVDATDFYLVLFLLSLQKDEIFKPLLLLSPDNIHNEIYKCISDSKIEYVDDYKTISEYFSPVINKISDRQLFELICIYKSLNPEVLKERFSEIFDFILYKISAIHGRETGEFILPYEIRRLMWSLSQLGENASVYNPFAGIGSFGVFMDSGQNYIGQEINSRIWALGILRLMAYQRFDNTSFSLGDSITNWLGEPNSFDLVIANPPFGVRIPKHLYYEIGHFSTFEHFLIQKGLESINETGKVIAMVSLSVLFSNGPEKQLREELIESDLLDTIIAFPGGLLNHTGIPFAIIVINKDKAISGKVRFVDAQKFILNSEERKSSLNYPALNSALSLNQETGSIRFVTNDQIRKYDYNLNVPRYFQKEFYGTKLGRIGDFIKGSRIDENSKGKFIRIRDLSDDKIQNKLNISVIEDTKVPNHARKIEESCILLAIRWKSFKPTSFQYSGTPIYIPSDIVAFLPDETKVNSDYLINEFYGEQIKGQAESFKVGSAIPTIRREDLLNIKVQLPSIQEQSAKVSGLHELSDKIKQLQKERNELAHGKSSSNFNEFASLKHTLGRPRQNILDWADNLLDFFKNTNQESFNHINQHFSEFYDISITQALSEIKKDINFISELLEKGEQKGLDLQDYPKTIIPLDEINKHFKQVTSNGFRFNLKKFYIKGEKLNQQGIEMNLSLLKILIDNILVNANKYGFPEKLPSNEVVIELSVIGDILNLEIKNNGLRFHDNYNKEKFIAKFSTSDSNKGSGLGGYDINRIAIEFGDDNWVLALNEDPIYKVKFKFQFPIKPLM